MGTVAGIFFGNGHLNSLLLKISFPKGVSFDIKYIYDLESFFNFYKVINAKALSRSIGMNQSLLAQYIKGRKTPSPVQTKEYLPVSRKLAKSWQRYNLSFKEECT